MNPFYRLSRIVIWEAVVNLRKRGATFFLKRVQMDREAGTSKIPVG